MHYPERDMTVVQQPRPKVAWAIHIFTSTGIIAGFLGLLSALDRSPRASLIWMMVAMVIDGLDGPLARKFDVATVVPSIDGHVMDLVIDYVTCVIAPAFFMHEFHLLPHKFSLFGIALVLLSSLYLFSSTHIQDEDNYFIGFPAMWNLVVNVMFVLQSRPTINLVVVIVLSILTVVPVKFIHPIRVRDFRSITLPVLVIWLSTMVYLTWIIDGKLRRCAALEDTMPCLPMNVRIAQAIIHLGSAWIIGVGLWHTFAPSHRKQLTT